MEDTVADAPAGATPSGTDYLSKESLPMKPSLIVVAALVLFPFLFPPSLKTIPPLYAAAAVLPIMITDAMPIHSAFFSPFRLSFPASWIEVVSDAAAVMRSP